MRRTWPILVATVALIAGCSSGESTIETVTVTASATAVESTLAGTSHPTETGLFANQFHPCEVFTEEQFAEAGLGKRTNAAENPESVVKSCGFGLPGPNDAGGNILVATDKIDWQETADLGLEPEYWTGAEANGVYTHRMSGPVRNCVAAMDFDWGRFLISYLEFGEGWDREELCRLPVSVLEYLVTQAGGNHGTES